MPRDEQIGAVYVATRVDFDQLERDLKEARRKATSAAGGMGEEMGREFSRASGEADSLGKTLDGLGETAKGVGLIFTAHLAKGLRGVLGFIGRTTTGLLDLTALGLLGVARGARQMAAGLRESESALRHVAPALDVAAGGFELVAKAILIVTGVLTGLQIAAAAATAGLIIAGHRAAASFVPAFNRVRTLLDDTTVDIRALRHEVSELAGDIGVDAVEAANAFYTTLSAMPRLAKEPTRALEILKVALEVARSGFADAGTAASAITGILNAFELEAEDARRVSDALFAAQNQGVTTFGEVASSIGTVADLTASLGGRFEDLLAILATTTDTGVGTAQRFTQLRGVIAAIIKPTEQAKEAIAGYDVALGAAALKSEGLVNFLLKLIRETGGDPDILARIFPQESISLVLSLARQTDVLQSKLSDIEHQGGLTRQITDEMTDSWVAQKDILKQQLSAALRDIGLQYEDFGTAALRRLNEIIAATREGKRETDKYIESFTTFMTDLLLIPVSGEAYRRTAERLRIPLPPLPQEERLNIPPVIPGFPPRARQPLARPQEPTSIEHSLEKIRDLENALRARAIADLARTGDVEAYEAALKAAQEAVNDLVLAEMERLRVAGVSETEINKLVGSYRVLKDTVKGISEAERERQRLSEQLNRTLDATTLTAAQQQRKNVDELEAAYKEAFGEISDEAAEKFAEIRRQMHLGEVLSVQQAAFRALLETPVTPDRIAAFDSLADAVRRQRDAVEFATPAWEAFQALLKQIEATIRGVKEETQDPEELTPEERLRQLRDQARGLEENARAAIQVAEAFGLIDSQAANAFQSIAQVASGIQRLAGGDLTAFPIVIGGVASLLSGITGESASQRALRETMQENVRALDRLRLEIEGWQLTFKGAQQARDIVGAAAGRSGPGILSPQRTRGILAQFEAQGLSRAELEAIAASKNIQLFDEKGRIIGQGLDALVQALDMTIESMIGFGETLEGKRREAETRAEIFDRELTPEERAQVEIDYLQEKAPNLVPKGGFDLTTPEGRAQAEAWQRKVFEQYAAGTLNIGGLTSEQFEEIWLNIDRNIDAMREQGEGSDSVTEGFQFRREVTEVTATRMVGMLSTLDARAADRNKHLLTLIDIERASRDALLSLAMPAPTFTPPSAAAFMLPRGAGGTTSIQFGDVNVELRGVRFEGGPATKETARMIGREIGAGIEERISRQLANQQIAFRRSRGMNVQS